ncbi:hypothetical protein PV797_00060 [Clostridiaceae bacterium M8S5]|nr:hypothetical protein PV797_00060 [Clostridiaceae bacterium M8S5]
MIKKLRYLKIFLSLLIIMSILYISYNNVVYKNKKYIKLNNNLLLSIYHNKICIFKPNKKLISKYEIGDENTEILSYDINDINNDKNLDIIILTRNKKEAYGNEIKIFSYSNNLNEIFSIDFKRFNPWKVQFCDVDGSNNIEISIGVYKKTKFHPVMAKRPFIFNYVDGQLIPKWRGSRLSKPFDDYIFVDIDYDQEDELISIEHLRDGQKVINSYNWNGFGFEGKTQSKPFTDILSISKANDNEFMVSLKKGNQEEMLNVKYDNNNRRFIYTKNKKEGF